MPHNTLTPAEKAHVHAILVPVEPGLAEKVSEELEIEPMVRAVGQLTITLQDLKNSNEQTVSSLRQGMAEQQAAMLATLAAENEANRKAQEAMSSAYAREATANRKMLMGVLASVLAICLLCLGIAAATINIQATATLPGGPTIDVRPFPAPESPVPTLADPAFGNALEDATPLRP